MQSRNEVFEWLHSVGHTPKEISEISGYKLPTVREWMRKNHPSPSFAQVTEKQLRAAYDLFLTDEQIADKLNCPVCKVSAWRRAAKLPPWTKRLIEIHSPPFGGALQAAYDLFLTDEQIAKKCFFPTIREVILWRKSKGLVAHRGKGRKHINYSKMESLILKGKSVEQIAKQLDCAVSTVEKRKKKIFQEKDIPKREKEKPMLAKAIYEIEYALNVVCAHGGIAAPRIEPVAVKSHDEVVELSVHIPGVDLHKYQTLLGAAMLLVKNNAKLPLRVRDASLEPLLGDHYQLYY